MYECDRCNFKVERGDLADYFEERVPEHVMESNYGGRARKKDSKIKILRGLAHVRCLRCDSGIVGNLEAQEEWEEAKREERRRKYG